MANVVPNLRSIMFTGSNNAAVEAVVTDPNFSVVESTNVRVKWKMNSEQELTYTSVAAGDWLLYAPSDGGFAPVRGISNADYEAQYHEIS